MSELIIDGFAGPGGWDVAAAALGLSPVVGIELDAAACATRAAAGLRTIRADISRYPAEALRGHVGGSIFSPVCTTFSAAGSRAGVAVMDVLADAVPEALQGRKTLAARRREMAAALRAAGWPQPGAPRSASYSRMPRRFRLDDDGRVVRKPWSEVISRPAPMDVIWKAVRSASLVVEPARFIHACRPEWVAMEQVPAVLPLWQAYADELRGMGYSAWCGKLNSADYGVPQTRIRAILIASRVHQVQRPMPTHYDPRKGMQLFGAPWVSMAEALGWGASARPGPAVTAGGTATGGAEPFPTRARDLLTAEQDAGRWVVRTSYGRPAATPRNGSHEMYPAVRPSHAVTGKTRSWTLTRPATTVQGDPRGGRPGHKDRDKGEAQFELDSVRVTAGEAAALQSFPPDYPWRGSATAQYQQIGNAIPPLLAEHVLAMATGITRVEAAA